MVGPGRPQFVFFGSSLVQHSFYEGWGAILANLYSRKADIVIRGYTGWNTRRALQVLDQIFPKPRKHPFGLSCFMNQNATQQPSLVIVCFGGNDSSTPYPSGLGPYVPLQEYVENLRKIANHIQSLSKKTRIIFLSNAPINEEQIVNNRTKDGRLKRTNEASGIYSEACMALCREMNITAIDLFSAIQSRKDWLDVCFIDGIHLSYEGSKIVVREILKVLKEAEWEPSLHWKSMPPEFGEDSPYDPVAEDGISTMNISNIPYPCPPEWD